MSLLGFLGAGAAQGYAQAKNLETEQQNKVGFAIIQAELEEQYKQRLAESAFKYDVAKEGIKHQREIATKDFEYGKKAEIEDIKHGYKLQQEKEKASTQRSIEGMKQDRADARSKAGITSREKVALLNNSHKSSGGMSIKDLTKSIEADRKAIFEVQKDLSNPMNANNPQTSKLLKDRIRELQSSVADKLLTLEGNAPKDDNEAKEMTSLFGK